MAHGENILVALFDLLKDVKRLAHNNIIEIAQNMFSIRHNNLTMGFFKLLHDY
jgi:hypothetical protein